MSCRNELQKPYRDWRSVQIPVQNAMQYLVQSDLQKPVRKRQEMVMIAQWDYICIKIVQFQFWKENGTDAEIYAGEVVHTVTSAVGIAW